MTWCYIGRVNEATKHCAAGEVAAVIVDCPEMKKEVPKTIAKWLRDGLSIERVPVEWVRKHLGTTEPYWPEQP